MPTEDRFKTLSWIQKLMLWYGVNEDKKEFYKTIEGIIDVLKPWLDKELWYNMKKDTEDVRKNINWNNSLDRIDEITILE